MPEGVDCAVGECTTASGSKSTGRIAGYVAGLITTFHQLFGRDTHLIMSEDEDAGWAKFETHKEDE